MFRLYFAATSWILAAGPTRIAVMIPASADSIAPRNELSSQGYTTMVDTFGTAFAAARRRSYFDPGCVPLASTGKKLMTSLRVLMTLWPGGRKGLRFPDHRAQTIRPPA